MGLDILASLLPVSPFLFFSQFLAVRPMGGTSLCFLFLLSV